MEKIKQKTSFLLSKVSVPSLKTPQTIVWAMVAASVVAMIICFYKITNVPTLPFSILILSGYVGIIVLTFRNLERQDREFRLLDELKSPEFLARFVQVLPKPCNYTYKEVERAVMTSGEVAGGNDPLPDRSLIVLRMLDVVNSKAVKMAWEPGRISSGIEKRLVSETRYPKGFIEVSITVGIFGTFYGLMDSVMGGGSSGSDLLSGMMGGLKMAFGSSIVALLVAIFARGFQEVIVEWKFGFSVVPAEASKIFRDIYLEPLFPPYPERPRPVDKTQIEERVKPFCFDIEPITGKSMWPKNPLRFIFYDPSGDVLSEPKAFDAMQYIRESRVVVFLIDPESVPGLRNRFLIPVSDSEIQPGRLGETDQILANLRELTLGAPPSRIIFALTKSDSFFREGYPNPFRKDPQLAAAAERLRGKYFTDRVHPNQVNIAWMEEYSRDCKEFLSKADERLGGILLHAEAISGESGVKAFLVSSLGTANIFSEKQKLGDSDDFIEVRFLDAHPTPRHLENILFCCDC